MVPKLTWGQCKPLFQHINSKYGFDSYESIYGDGHKNARALSESSLHELCHLTILGPEGRRQAHPFADIVAPSPPHARGTAYIGDRIRAMMKDQSPNHADAHELDVCATEIMVSRLLVTVPIDLEKLISFSADNMHARGLEKDYWVHRARRRLSLPRLRPYVSRVFDLLMEIGKTEKLLPKAS